MSHLLHISFNTSKLSFILHLTQRLFTLFLYISLSCTRSFVCLDETKIETKLSKYKQTDIFVILFIIFLEAIVFVVSSSSSSSSSKVVRDFLWTLSSPYQSSQQTNQRSQVIFWLKVQRARARDRFIFVWRKKKLLFLSYLLFSWRWENEKVTVNLSLSPPLLTHELHQKIERVEGHSGFQMRRRFWFIMMIHCHLTLFVAWRCWWRQRCWWWQRRCWCWRLCFTESNNHSKTSHLLSTLFISLNKKHQDALDSFITLYKRHFSLSLSLSFIFLLCKFDTIHF